MANITENEKEKTEKIINTLNNMTEEERERVLWISEGIIFARQMKNNDR